MMTSLMEIQMQTRITLQLHCLRCRQARDVPLRYDGRWARQVSKSSERSKTVYLPMAGCVGLCSTTEPGRGAGLVGCFNHIISLVGHSSLIVVLNRRSRRLLKLW